ncbi:MAG: tetratricopeptide repeat protein [Flavobacteriales bacterium]
MPVTFLCDFANLRQCCCTLFCAIIFHCFSNPSLAQNKLDAQIDSLERVVSSATEDSVKSEAMYALASKLRKKDPGKMLSVSLEIINLARKSGDKQAMSKAYFRMRQYNYDKNDYLQAISYNKKAISLIAESGKKDDKFINSCEVVLSNAYRMLGQYEKSIAHSLSCIKTATRIKDTTGIISAYNNIAIVQHYQSNNAEALDYFSKALRLAKEGGDKAMIARQLNNIGVIYKTIGEIDRALEYYLLELNTWNKLHDEHGLVVTYNNIGALYSHKKQNEKALDYYMRSLKLAKKLKDARTLAETLAGIAEVYNGMDNPLATIAYADSARMIAVEIGYKEFEKSTLGIMSKSYEKLGRFDKALEFLQKSDSLKDSLVNLKNKQAIARMQASYEAEKKDNKIRLLEEQKKLQQEKISHNATQRNMLMLGIAMLLLMGLLLLRSFRLKHKANILLVKQNEEIEEKNKRITDSIVYASRIQNAILPSISSMEEQLGDAFVLYMPKDIVSGDFYWYAENSGGGKNEISFAVADCTGHGVPGAMMSVIGSTGLNRCTHEFGLSAPDSILNRLNQLVEDALAISGEELNDGMDIALCRLQYQDNGDCILAYAGANNPLWVVKRSGGKGGDKDRDTVSAGAHPLPQATLHEVKPDKQPIGLFAERKPFKNNEIHLKKGDTIYIFSDGFADQFGGSQGKKFKIKRFKDLILSINDKPMKEQAELIRQNFFSWKGQLDQVDDICMVGLRI